MNIGSILGGFWLALMLGGITTVLGGLGWGLVILTLAGLYFVGGFHKVPVAHRGILTLFGARAGLIFKEGWLWLPRWLANVQIVDWRKRSVELAVTDVQSKDELDIGFKLSAVVQVSNIDRFLELNDPWGGTKDGETVNKGPVVNEISEALREAVSHINADPGTGARITAARRKIEKDVKEIIETEHSQFRTWGLTLESLQIGDINLPPELQEAVTRRRVEEAEREAEGEEMTTVIELAKRMRSASGDTMNFEDCVKAIQTERGKATRIIIDGAGGDSFLQGSIIAGFGRDLQPKKRKGRR